MTEQRGKYIVIEGGEGMGKTTQVKLLAQSLGALVVCEPGGDAVGQHIRKLLLDPTIEFQSPKSEVLLHAAQRAELMVSTILPSLETGRHVVSDRSWFSSAAYQGAQGVNYDDILLVNRFAVTDMIQPDALVLLDTDPRIGFDRKNDKPNRYEKMDSAFHGLVRDHFAFLVDVHKGIIIDAAQSITDVQAGIRTAIQERLSL